MRVTKLRQVWLSGVRLPLQHVFDVFSFQVAGWFELGLLNYSEFSRLKLGRFSGFRALSL